MPQAHIERVIAHAAEKLIPLRRKAKNREELLLSYRRFIKLENHRLRLLHRQGGGGVEVAEKRAQLLDVVINDLLGAYREGAFSAKNADDTAPLPQVALVACGGYGRGVLNPGSDIDLMFLVGKEISDTPAVLQDLVETLLYMMMDVGFKVSQSVRTVSDSLTFANEDHPTKTALLDARFVAGNVDIFEEFQSQFFQRCVEGREQDYLGERSRDIRSRHQKFGQTVHLQEPNVKEGCGGLRDFHNIIWILWVLRRTRDLNAVVSEKLLGISSVKAMENAYEFLMRVRNSLHYLQKKQGDILTLRLQGQVAEDLNYPQKTKIRRIEAFMRDYYGHTRRLYQYSTSLMENFELDLEVDKPSRFIGFLARRKKRVEHFDGFFSKNGLIYPDSEEIFNEDSKRMMRIFLHMQQRHLEFSPSIRRLFRRSLPLLNRGFLYSKANRETFEEILQHRGDVARVLRLMHRVGFLGRYLPEFGELTDLVQHEFFHQFTADEHTLRCIDELDALVLSEDPKTRFFRQLFLDLEDPYILYIALIMHDAGRSENMRHHEDASALLASKVARRLRITGDRLKRLIFLVDNHLIFWRVATTKDLGDPSTIEDFAKAMRSRSYMESLLLFTHVDSKGTSHESWTAWKESLVMQLYRNTCSYYEDRVGYAEQANQPVDTLREKILGLFPATYEGEIEAHFATMPARYFRFRGAASIQRHVRLFHRFFKRLSGDDLSSLVPVVNWEARPDEGYSLAEFCCWNRHLLLTKVAGAFAARNINILSADLFTRSDSLVLDIFRVCTTNFQPVTSEREIAKVEALVEKAFRVGEDCEDFRQIIQEANRPSLFREALEIEIPQRVVVSNFFNPLYTVLELQAQDRIGLLYDVFTAIGELKIEVVIARISTQAGAAIDSFYLVDTGTEKKVEDPARLKQLEVAVKRAVGL